MSTWLRLGFGESLVAELKLEFGSIVEKCGFTTLTEVSLASLFALVKAPEFERQNFYKPGYSYE
jgi:hypothetical protein